MNPSQARKKKRKENRHTRRNVHENGFDFIYLMDGMTQNPKR